MTTRLLICLTLWSLYTTGCLSEITGKIEPNHHTRGTSDSSIPRRPSFIIGEAKLQPQRTNTP